MEVVEADRARPSAPELVEDLQDLLLDRFLDLPTLMSLGYTSKTYVSRVAKVLRKSGGKARLHSFYSDVAKLGYFELFKFFLLEIPPRCIPGLTTPDDSKMVVLEAIAHGRLEFVKRLMTCRDDRFVGFFCGYRMRMPAGSFNNSILHDPLCKSNSPAMLDLLMEAKIEFNLLSLAITCIHQDSVNLLRHVFKASRVKASFSFLADLPCQAISYGAIGVLDLFINELKLIRVDGNTFIATLDGQDYGDAFDSTWLLRSVKDLLTISTYLDRFGVEVTYSPDIGMVILLEGNPDFLVYLREKKGIDYRNLVSEKDFDQLFQSLPKRPAHVLEKSKSSFYNMVFRDRQILEMFDRDLTNGLIKFLGWIATTDPGMALTLVAWIYDESPWSHSLPHPFQLLMPSGGRDAVLTEEVLRFCLDFSWTFQIDEISFFKNIRYLDASKPSSFVRFIAEYIDLRQRDNSDFLCSAVAVQSLMSINRLPLKTLHEILLMLPLKKDTQHLHYLSDFLKLKCATSTELDSFFAIVQWMESKLGCVIASTLRDAIPQILVTSNQEILSRLIDRGLSMLPDAPLVLLRQVKDNSGDFAKSEICSLENLLEKLRLLKQRGVDFPKILLDGAFKGLILDSKSSNGLHSLFCHSEHIARIFDFLIDDCGCPLHENVLLEALRIYPEGKVERDRSGVMKTIKYLCNRRCPMSDKCYKIAIGLDETFGWTHFTDLLISYGYVVPPSLMVSNQNNVHRQ